MDDNGDGLFDRGERFVYDGWDLVLVYDESGSLENRYLYGPAVDQFFADENSLGEVLWGLTDHQGTVRDLVEYDQPTNSTAVVNHVQYDSFGKITAQSDPAHEPLQAYTGREWDADAGLYYYRTRWYDPVLHQFVSEDWIGFFSGDTNVRRYVLNNPTSWTDPFGFGVWSLAVHPRGLSVAQSFSYLRPT